LSASGRLLQLRPSPALAAAIVGAHGAAGFALWLLMQNLPGALLGAALLALGAATAWSRALLRGRGAVRALELGEDELLVRFGSGKTAVAPLGRRRYVSRLLVTLPLGGPALSAYGGRTLLVSADMLERGEFRRLRVWALWGRLPDVAAGQLAG